MYRAIPLALFAVLLVSVLLLGKANYAQQKQIKTLQTLHAEQKAQYSGVIDSQAATIQALQADYKTAERAVLAAQQNARESAAKTEAALDEIKKLQQSNPAAKNWANTPLPADVKRVLRQLGAADSY